MRELHYETPNGVTVIRQSSTVSYRKGLSHLVRELDSVRGAYLSSGYEFPGRYSRWDIASVKPPLEIVAYERDVVFRPLNERGALINRILYPILKPHPYWNALELRDGALHGVLKPMPKIFPEEARSKQPSVFSVVRSLIAELGNELDPRLSLIGVFGYDLLLQFDPIEKKLPRERREDLHLFLCDDIYFIDRKKERIDRYQYEFEGRDIDGLQLTTAGLKHSAERVPPQPFHPPAPITSDHTTEEYMAKVEVVREGMRKGDYYEVVLRQTFRTPYSGQASDLFHRMQQTNPSPYEFLLQFGSEALVGASPEMFLRAEGRRIETCPIAGTARRTGDAMQDAAAIRELLMSLKEESELTMCTDVDRNDKSRVCEPGSVKVLGRRLIESYAGLFHTVDHVEGTLKEGFDALDAFLSHLWAVTLIGAPKKAAAVAIESLEKTSRSWYAGAIGMVSLNGDTNTGTLIRTTFLRDGYAEYSAGATLLYDSIPANEERETRLKATGFFRLLGPKEPKPQTPALRLQGDQRMKLLLVDHEDCFIHTLANYAQQTGAEVVTYRWGFPDTLFDEVKPDLVLISPGPARPSDFGVPDLVLRTVAKGLPIFGVCLGLQGIVEAFGGELDVLDYPMHGKPSVIRTFHRGVFEGLPETFAIGRYHSLFARRETLPDCLEITAETEEGVIMGLRHKTLPIEAVQFHPESILSLTDEIGLRIMRNALKIAAGDLAPK